LPARAPPAIVAQHCSAHTIELVFDLDIAKVGPALILRQAVDQLVQQFLGSLAPNMLANIWRHGKIHPPAGRVVEQQRGACGGLGAALGASRRVESAFAQLLGQIGSLGRVDKRPCVGLEAGAAGWAG
jgi:hypothetical protein